MIMALGNPEIRQRSVDLETQALMDDCRVREIDKVVRESWSELASISIRVRDRELWKLLPQNFHSFDAWILDAAPCCRATIYRGMGILSTIANDLSPEDIAGIEIGNASLLAQLSPGVRRDPEVIEAAKGARLSSSLRNVVRRKYPLQHVQLIVEKKCRFTEDQWESIEPKFDAYKLIDPTASFEVFIEWLCSEQE